MPELSMMPITLAIVIVTITVTIVAFYSRNIFGTLMLHIGAILHGAQTWRIATSGLIHADWLHLAFNMFSLVMFGAWMEQVIGGWRLLLVYICGVVVGSLASLVAHRNNYEYRAVGASGGVCAIIGASSILAPEATVRFFLLPVPMPAWIAGCLFIAASVYSAKRGFDSIGHEAHLGGTAAGIVLIVAFFPIIVSEYWMYILAMIATGAIMYAIVNRK